MADALQDRLIRELIDREGGYVNHPNDRGGPTNFGITQAVARRYGYHGDMRDLPMSVAHRIYAARYWSPLGLDHIPHDELRVNLFDFGVHSGTGRSGRALQRVINVLNRRGEDYPDIAVDGAVGPATRAALTALVRHRGERAYDVVAAGVNGLRQAFLIELAENRDTQESFSYGWMDRVMLIGDGHV